MSPRLALFGFAFAATVLYAADPRVVRSDIVVVGAGISGLSAALEAGRAGAIVTVLDMSSVFGGHAVMSEGGVSMVDTPVQRREGIKDSIQLASADFRKFGEDVNEEWVRFYVQNSRREVYDWLTALGVEFERTRMPAGNSVPRFHETRGRGMGLVAPIYRAALALPNITFAWNTQATNLTTSGGRVTCVETKNRRDGFRTIYQASSVILATGGFQSNLTLLREHWPNQVAFPQRLLLGSGVNSLGLGHELARAAGARLSHLDYQWMYPYGLPDPRDPRSDRGLNAKNDASIWVNAQGQRFINEMLTPKFSVAELLRQPGATYWAIFDKAAKPFFRIAGTDWIDFSVIEREIFANPKLVKTAPTLAALAVAAGLPAAALEESVRRYNRLFDRGDDLDFGRFGASSQRFAGLASRPRTTPRRIEEPPFYAVQFYPMSRKNNGGVAIDLKGRVLSAAGAPIPGLYAVGELTGSAGMNGRAGLEGVWLGPGVLTGRVAGRTAAADIEPGNDRPSRVRSPEPPSRIIAETKSCTECHNIDALVQEPRSGYWHFEQVHRTVQQRTLSCVLCHSELVPSSSTPHRVDPLIRAASCTICHGTN